MLEYEGFAISVKQITDGKIKYDGLVAEKHGVKITSPKSEPLNIEGMELTIKEFINNKITL